MRFYLRTSFLVVTVLALHSLQQSFAQVSHEAQDSALSPHARDVLLAAARDRSDAHPKEKVLPPLESLVSKSGEILQDPQFLLDFAVVGFGKCGTTTLLQWLQQSSNNSSNPHVVVRAPNYEAQFLVNQRPEKLVSKLYSFAIEEQELQQQFPTQSARIVKGFKNPSDIRRQKSRDLLKQYWPQTPLIVSVRHPVSWMVSLYNYFKIEKGMSRATLTAHDIVDTGGRSVDGDTHHYVSSAKGEFHAMLAELGKTPLADSNEWRLLRPWLQPREVARIRRHALPNPIFFLEMGQLADATTATNATRAQQFARDLEAFLGLPQGHLPPVLHVRPRSDQVKGKDTDGLKMDICQPQWTPLLEEMMAIARAASDWLQQYFIVSPGVTISSPEYVKELLEQWKVNPCERVSALS